MFIICKSLSDVAKFLRCFKNSSISPKNTTLMSNRDVFEVKKEEAPEEEKNKVPMPDRAEHDAKAR